MADPMLQAAAAKPRERRIVLRRRKAPRLGVHGARRGGGAGAAQHGASRCTGCRAGPGPGVDLARRVGVAGPGGAAAGGPLQHLAEHETARAGAARGSFPLGLGGQAAAGPGAPGLGFVARHVHRRLLGRRPAAAGPGAAAPRPGASAPHGAARGARSAAARPSRRVSTSAVRRNRRRARTRRNAPS